MPADGVASNDAGPSAGTALTVKLHVSVKFIGLSVISNDHCFQMTSLRMAEGILKILLALLELKQTKLMKYVYPMISNRSHTSNHKL